MSFNRAFTAKSKSSCVWKRNISTANSYNRKKEANHQPNRNRQQEEEEGQTIFSSQLQNGHAIRTVSHVQKLAKTTKNHPIGQFDDWKEVKSTFKKTSMASKMELKNSTPLETSYLNARNRANSVKAKRPFTGGRQNFTQNQTQAKIQKSLRHKSFTRDGVASQSGKRQFEDKKTQIISINGPLNFGSVSNVKKKMEKVYLKQQKQIEKLLSTGNKDGQQKTEEGSEYFDQKQSKTTSVSRLNGLLGEYDNYQKLSKGELIEKLISLEYLAQQIFKKNKALEEQIKRNGQIYFPS